MYEASLAENAYSSSAQCTSTPRGIEYKLFARVTRQLASANTAANDQFSQLAQAIYDNERLWTALARDVADEGNKLPADLRSKIFYLFQFTRQQGRKVLKGAASPDILVEINTAMMRGLQGDARQMEAAS